MFENASLKDDSRLIRCSRDNTKVGGKLSMTHSAEFIINGTRVGYEIQDERNVRNKINNEQQNSSYNASNICSQYSSTNQIIDSKRVRFQGSKARKMPDDTSSSAIEVVNSSKCYQKRGSNDDLTYINIDDISTRKDNTLIMRSFRNDNSLSRSTKNSLRRSENYKREAFSGSMSLKSFDKELLADKSISKNTSSKTGKMKVTQSTEVSNKPEATSKNAITSPVAKAKSFLRNSFRKSTKKVRRKRNQEPDTTTDKIDVPLHNLQSELIVTNLEKLTIADIVNDTNNNENNKTQQTSITSKQTKNCRVDTEPIMTTIGRRNLVAKSNQDQGSHIVGYNTPSKVISATTEHLRSSSLVSSAPQEEKKVSLLINLSY